MEPLAFVCQVLGESVNFAARVMAVQGYRGARPESTLQWSSWRTWEIGLITLLLSACTRAQVDSTQHPEGSHFLCPSWISFPIKVTVFDSCPPLSSMLAGRQESQARASIMGFQRPGTSPQGAGTPDGCREGPGDQAGPQLSSQLKSGVEEGSA